MKLSHSCVLSAAGVQLQRSLEFAGIEQSAVQSADAASHLLMGIYSGAGGARLS